MATFDSPLMQRSCEKNKLEVYLDRTYEPYSRSIHTRGLILFDGVAWCQCFNGKKCSLPKWPFWTMHWDTLGFLAYDYTKNTLRSRGLLCRIVDHIKEHEMWQLQRKLFSRRNKAHNHLQIMDSSSTTTSFSLKQSRSFLGNAIYSHLVRIAASNQGVLEGDHQLRTPQNYSYIWTLFRWILIPTGKKKLRLRRSSRMQNEHFFFGFKRITFFLGSKWHQRVGS